MASLNPGCTKCGLFEGAKTVCMAGRGNTPADLLVYGQNPGRTEDRVGEPFVGESGTLINRLLASVDSSISIHISNSVKCYTPENRKPTIGEQDACRPYLIDELVRIRPLAILALGNEALTSLTGQGGVSKKLNVPTDLRANIRSRLLDSGFTHSTLPKVLPTWHPAYILRDRNHYHELEESVIAASRYIKELRGDDVGAKIDWREWGTPKEIEDLVVEAAFTPPNGYATIGYDIETNALPFHHPDFRIHMLGFSNGKTAFVARRPGHIAYVISKLRELQDQGLITLVGYNSVSFDDVATGLLSKDCLYLDYLCDEGVSSYNGRNQKGRHKLQSSVVRHLQIPPWKDEVTWDWGTFDEFGANWEAAALYNARDALYTTLNYNILSAKLTNKQTRLVEYIMQPAGRFLAKLEQRGVPISLENLEQVKLEVAVAREKALDALVRKAFEYDLWTFNPNSHPQVRELLFEKMKLRPVSYTGKGDPSTDEETIRDLILTTQSEGHLKTLHSLLSYRKETKLLSTYIKTCTPEADGRIHSSYSITQTTTGRPAGYGWSPLRVPREKRIRRVVAAPPGMKLVSADLSQIEMRTMAWLSQEPNMLAVYRDGKYGGDMHNFMASAMCKALYGRETYSKEERDLAKRIGFGCLYGAEWFTLQSTMLNDFGIRLSEEECKFLRDEVFFKSLPGLPEYYNRVIRKCQKDGFVEGTFGLRRQLPNINARDMSLKTAAAREAINTDNQGLAYYLAMIGCILLENSPEIIEQVAFIYDATLGLIKEGTEEEATARIKYVFETKVSQYVELAFGINFDVPIVVDVKISQAWGE